MGDNSCKNTIFIDTLEKNYELINSELFCISTQKGYFSPFRTEGVVPEKIVSDIFLKMIVSALKINDRSILKEQYVWTRDMLASRGYPCELFIKNYLSYLNDLKEIMVSYANKEHYLFISALIEDLKLHFIECVRGK